MRALFLAVFVLVIVLAARLLWIASRLEAGMDTLTAMMRYSATNWLGLERLPLSYREPSQQADFWLAEVDRITRKRPLDRDLELGAAWVLDSPGTSHFARHLETVSVTGLPIAPQVNLDYEAIRRAEDEFEAQCANRCLALALQVARRDSVDPLGWRSVALLVQRRSLDTDAVPRVADPIAIWQECAQNDPKNALYDYLSALYLWARSGSFDYDEKIDDTIVVIADEKRFAGIAPYLDRGRQKPFFAIGEMAFPAIAKFLAESQLSRTEQPDIALDRKLSYRGSVAVLNLFRFQQAQAQEQLRTGKPAAAMAIYIQNLRLLEQVKSAGEVLAFEQWVPQLVRSTLDEIEAIAKDHPRLITADQQTALKRQRTDNDVYAQQIGAMGAITSQSNLRFKPEDYVSKSLLVESALTMSLLLAAVTILAFSFGHLASKPMTGDPARLGVVRSVYVWLVTFGITFTVLGMLPAGFVSAMGRRRLTTCLIILVESTMLLLAGYGLMCWLRRRNYRWSIRELAMVIALFAVIFTSSPFVIQLLSPLHDSTLDFLPLVRGWDSVSGSMLRNALRVQDGEWSWAFVQWVVHWGPAITIAGSLLLLMLWCLLRLARQQGHGFFQCWRSLDRANVARVPRTLGSSAVWAGVCCLLVWLCVAPSVLRATEAWHQARMTYLRDPARYWHNLRTLAVSLDRKSQFNSNGRSQ